MNALAEPSRDRDADRIPYELPAPAVASTIAWARPGCNRPFLGKPLKTLSVTNLGRDYLSRARDPDGRMWLLIGLRP